MITEEEYKNAVKLTMDYREQQRIKEAIEAKNIDKGKGKCMEKGCNNFAITDYNGHGYFVCKRCDDVLTSRFDDEYN